MAAAAGATCVLAVLRSWGWGARHAFKLPLLWILHLGYLWIPVGVALRSHHGHDGSGGAGAHGTRAHGVSVHGRALRYSSPALFGRSPSESTSQVRRRSYFPRASI
ncbi:MAG: NnrS family protein [Polyangiaceae bacterium]